MALFIVDHCLGMIVINKAASNTVQNAIRASGKNFVEATAHEFKKMERRVAFIRDPRHRIESAYRMYVVRGCAYPHNLSGFEGFVLQACENDYNDPHVYAQARHCAPKGEYLMNEVLRWDFKALATLLGLESVGHDFPSNKAIETLWTPRAEEKWRQAYAADIWLWWGRDV